jgi:hypothetical protein
MRMRVETTHIVARAILQDASPLGMPLGGSGWLHKAEGGHTGKRTTGGHEEGAARSCERVVGPVRGHHSSPFMVSL